MFDNDENFEGMFQEEGNDEREVNDIRAEEEGEEVSYYKPPIAYSEYVNDSDNEEEGVYKAQPVSYNQSNSDYSDNEDSNFTSDYSAEPNDNQDFDVSNTNFGKNTVNDILASQQFKTFGSGLRKNQNGLFDIQSPGQRGFAGIAIISGLIALLALVVCYFMFKI